MLPDVLKTMRYTLGSTRRVLFSYGIGYDFCLCIYGLPALKVVADQAIALPSQLEAFGLEAIWVSGKQ